MSNTMKCDKCGNPIRNPFCHINEHIGYGYGLTLRKQTDAIEADLCADCATQLACDFFAGKNAVAFVIDADGAMEGVMREVSDD